jgi:hypothetical protein
LKGIEAQRGLGEDRENVKENDEPDGATRGMTREDCSNVARLEMVAENVHQNGDWSMTTAVLRRIFEIVSAGVVSSKSKNTRR